MKLAAQIAQASEGRFVIEDWHNFGADYEKTLLAWRDNFLGAWPSLQQRYGERFRRMWEFYLAYNLFRMAAILHGIAQRAAEGTAAAADATAPRLHGKPIDCVSRSAATGPRPRCTPCAGGGSGCRTRASRSIER